MPAAKPTDTHTRASIPESEMDRCLELVRQSPDYRSPTHVMESYAQLGLKVIPDPFGREVVDLAVQALRAEAPYSVVRLGDGEMNILAFGVYGTPHLDRHCFCASVERREDAFFPSELWMLALRDMMMSAVLQADVVGVLGLWRSRRKIDPRWWSVGAGHDSNLRGSSGHWRGIDYMLRLARSGLFQNKVVASAHLYFGLITHLDDLIANARRTLLVTSKSGVLKPLRARFPASDIDQIKLKGSRDREAPLPDSPDFLWTFASALPDDLRGTCCLVGAGPWSELYCSWIKQKGGVALDIGTGFDLMAGRTPRSVHRRLGLDKANPFAL